ncbi:hypothetical protein LguiA_034426 [Lonicera macranthoides]
MGDVKKWTVTYTKHVKQKRKVYQDGFLEIHSSTHKVILYDECETLLDSRFVKTDDNIRSGETLTFGAYLVDIGDPHGEHNPTSNLNLQGMDKKINEKARSLHGRSFKTNPCSIEWQVLYTTQITQKAKKFHDGVLQVAMNGLQGTQVMLYDLTRRLLDSRFLKKDEIVRSGESLTFDCHLVEVGEREGDHNPPVGSNAQGRNCNVVGKIGILQGQQVQTHNNCPVEWQVLYTTQITQKAKKFHDGVLKVAMNGLQGTQAMLYDSTRRLLDSRFLKKEEIVRSGKSLTFDGHLVEVGECEGDHKPPLDSNVQGRNCNVVGKTGIPQGQQVQIHNNYPVEWEAMYTTQVTQKAKKYHNGILRVAPCGSYRMQVVLLNEDGTVLSRKHFELSKEISCGSTLELPNYLVELGEQRKLPEREPQNGASKWKAKEVNVRSTGVDNIILSRRATTKKLLRDGEPQDNASAFKDTDPNIRSSGADNIRLSMRVPTTKPLRDAHAILSVLKKPVTQEGFATIKMETGECDASYSDIWEERGKDSCCERSEIENFDGRTNRMHNCGDEILTSEAVFNDLLVDPANSADLDKRGDSQPIIHTTSSFSFGSEAQNISRPSFVEPQVLDVLNLESDGPELMSSKGKSRLHFVLLQSNKTKSSIVMQLPSINKNVFAAAFSLSSRQSSKAIKTGKKSQPCANNMGISVTRHGNFGIATSNDTSNDPCNVEEKNPEEHISKKTTDEFPSFDLGF